VSPEDLLDLFDATATAVREALVPLVGVERRARTSRPGQYALDVVADAAALDVLGLAPVAVVSEESGASGDPAASITVVIDPVDGSTNCSRGIPYWSTSLCAVDADGPLAALVVNHATGTRFTAIRGAGAWRDGEPARPATATKIEDSVVCLSGVPKTMLPWRQMRALGSAALSLCDVAAGSIEAFLDGVGWHAPWDYLGGLLVCWEAGAHVVDRDGRELVTVDPDERRHLLAGCTVQVVDAMRPAL